MIDNVGIPGTLGQTGGALLPGGFTSAPPTAGLPPTRLPRRPATKRINVGKKAAGPKNLAKTPRKKATNAIPAKTRLNKLPSSGPNLSWA